MGLLKEQKQRIFYVCGGFSFLSALLILGCKEPSEPSKRENKSALQDYVERPIDKANEVSELGRERGDKIREEAAQVGEE